MRQILVLLSLISTNSFAFWGFSKSFSFNFDKGLCLNSKNVVGLNSAHEGECSDFRKMSAKRLKKQKLYGINLRGSNFDGLDLTGIDLEKSNLYNTSFRGSNLRYAYLNDSYLEGAVYDSKTTLPFGEIEAAKRGMINVERIYSTQSNGIHITFRDLEDESPEWVKTNLQSESMPSERFHLRLLNLISEARTITLPMVEAVISTSYFTATKFEQNIEAMKTADETTLYRLGLDNSDGMAISIYLNEAISRGLAKAKNYDLEGALNLLGNLFPADPKSNNFTPTNQAFVNALRGITTKDITSLKRLMALAQKKRAVSASVMIANEIKRGEVLTDPKNLRNFLIDNVATANRDQIVSSLAKELVGLDKDSLVSLLSLVEKQGKDALLMRYLELAKELTVDDLLFLNQYAYENGQEVRMNFLNKIKNFELEDLKKLLTIARAKEIDSMIEFFILSRVAIEIKDLIELTKLALNERILRDLIIQNLGRIVGWNSTDVTVLADYLLEFEKDTLLLFYSGTARSLTTEDFNRILSRNYNKYFDLVEKNITKVSDLKVDTILDLLRGYYGFGLKKDNLILMALPTVTDLTTASLQKLIFYATAKKDEIRKLGEEILARQKN